MCGHVSPVVAFTGTNLNTDLKKKVCESTDVQCHVLSGVS